MSPARSIRWPSQAWAALLIACLVYPRIVAAEIAVDSTAAPADTAARADSSAQQDSIKIPQPDSVMRLLEKRAGPLGEKVIYSGEKITFFPSKNVVLIRGQASVESGPQRVSSDSLIATIATPERFLSAARHS